MEAIKTKFLSIAFILTYLTGLSQTAKTIEALEGQYQTCLDKGEIMLSCSERFYFQMDSLLNVEYKNLKEKCDSTQKHNLRNDQLKWIVIRDKQFKYNNQKIHKESKKSGYESGQDKKMILIDKNAMFVKDRVIELMNDKPETYSANKYRIKNYRIITE